ncbi:uncharacterized protein METZ01_LOCUS372462, partial [marine metagenome]
FVFHINCCLFNVSISFNQIHFTFASKTLIL